ncbi:MAG: stage II sporulation protein P [Limnochordia bacterium]|nr:stage II sporulation protein P [Limnochordia bacterium]
MSRLIAVIVSFPLLFCVNWAVAFSPPKDECFELTDHYWQMVDQAGDALTLTARLLGKGDQYIAADNRMYEVIDVGEDVVHCKYIETVELPDVGSLTSIGGTTFFQDVFAALSGRWAVNMGTSGPIALYHTHSDESFVPTSGIESKDVGDIYEVGRTFRDEFQSMGYKALWSQNNHNPHDGGAYMRSRRTAMQLMKSAPSTLIDVHRDALPPEFYATEVEGMPASKVRIVVGRQNPNMATNLEYAKRIKAVADDKYPGIIEGIFMAQGNYNQDLGPKAILLEMGTHTISLERAQNAAKFFSEVIPVAAGIGMGTQPSVLRRMGSAALATGVFLFLLMVVAIVAFTALNSGSMEEFKGKVSQIFRGDFSAVVEDAGSLLGQRRD